MTRPISRSNGIISPGAQIDGELEQDVISVWYTWPSVTNTCSTCTKAFVRRKIAGVVTDVVGVGPVTAVPGDVYATYDQPGDNAIFGYNYPWTWTWTFTYELECVEGAILGVRSTDTRTFTINGTVISATN